MLLKAIYSPIPKYVDISMNNTPYTITLARFPNLANVQVIVDFTIIIGLLNIPHNNNINYMQASSNRPGLVLPQRFLFQLIYRYPHQPQT